MRAFFVWILCVWVSAGDALAQDQPSPPKNDVDRSDAQRRFSNFPSPFDDKGTLTIVVENDAIFGPDENYTNGFRAAWLSGTKEPVGIPKILHKMIGVDGPSVIRRGYAIGHQIYTPEDILATGPLPDQHPYAGYIYAERTTVIEQPNRVDQFTAQIGLVGPSAGGEWVQNEVHNLIGTDEALGWENQLDDELGIAISYDRTFRRPPKIRTKQLEMDITQNFGGTVGNIQTYINGGATIRLGQDLRNDYGPPRIRPSLAGTGYFTPTDNFGWYVFVGGEVRAVAHNIFIDGSLFRDSNVDLNTRTFVGDIQFGGVLQFGDLQVALTAVRRTEEFKEQTEAHQFGALSISKKF